MDRFYVKDHTDYRVLLIYKLSSCMLYWTIISFNTIHITCITHLDVAHIPAPDPDFELVVREVPLQLRGPHQGGGDTDIAPWPGPKDRNRVQYRHDPINQLIPYTHSQPTVCQPLTTCRLNPTEKHVIILTSTRIWKVCLSLPLLISCQ